MSRKTDVLDLQNTILAERIVQLQSDLSRMKSKMEIMFNCMGVQCKALCINTKCPVYKDLHKEK